MKSGFPNIDSLLDTRKRICCLFVAILLGIAAGAQAQNRDIDTLAPIIELDELQESIAGVSQVFTAQVVDDRVVSNVALYHRREGQSAYRRVTMNPLGLSGIFSATIDTDPEDLRNIEYYIQALDDTGNRTVSAFAFAPYSRTLQAESDTISSAGTSTSEKPGFTPSNKEPFYKNRWVQIGFGVIAVGVLASQLDTDDGDDRQTVPVTINIQ